MIKSKLISSQKSNKSKTNWLGFFGLSLTTLGVLGVVALFLPTSMCACGSPGKNTVGTIIRSQQAYHFESKKFANSIEQLGVSIAIETEYKVKMSKNENMVLVSSIPTEHKDGYQSYIGGIFYLEEEGTYQQVLCEFSDTEQASRISPPSLINNEAVCPEGTEITR